jgi:hypothetical protein
LGVPSAAVRKVALAFMVTATLVISTAMSGPTIAGAASARVAKTSCTTMGMSPASLRPHFGNVTVTAASYECGLVGDDFEVTLYLYPASERAAVGQEVHIKPAHRIGGLGVGAIFANYGGGDFALLMTSGSHCVYIDGQLLASQGKLVALAHIIYRALA